MKITICGSIAFYDQMQEIKNKLEKIGHEVKIPPNQILNNQKKFIPVSKYYQLRKTKNENWIWKELGICMKNHYQKIKNSDAVLILNYDKNKIKNYIGGNTLIEIATAFNLNKKIFFIYPIPKLSYTEEIKAMQPIIINNNLSKILDYSINSTKQKMQLFKN